MNKTKFFLLLIILAKFGIANSQTTKEFIVNEKNVLNKKGEIYTEARIQAFHADNKRKFPIILIRVEGCSKVRYVNKKLKVLVV